MNRDLFAWLALAAVVLTAPALAFGQTSPAGPADGWVVLPVKEYRELRERAYPSPPPALAPAVPATVSRVEYDLLVDGPAATGQVRVTADVFTPEWVFVPIPEPLRVRQATVEGRTVALVDGKAAGTDAGGRSVLLRRPGRHVIVLDVTAAVDSAGGAETLSLPESAAPVQKATVTLRGADAALTAAGGLVEQRTAVAPQSTRFVVAGRPGEPLVLSWGRRAAPAAARPLRFRGSVTSMVGLGEESAQVSAQVALEIVGGVLDRVSLPLPADFVVGQVTGPLVADWEMTQGNRLVVSLLEPAEGTAGFSVSGEGRSSREGRVAVPLLRLAGAERETGGIAVEVLGAGEITGHTARGLDPADASQLSETIAARRSPALAAFRYQSLASDAPRSLEVDVARYTQQDVLLANVDEARYRVLLTEDGKTLVEARFAVRNTQRSFLGLSLPPGAVLWTTSVDGRPVRPGRTPEGAVLLPILKDRREAAARSLVELMYVTRGSAWPDEGVVALALPALDLPVSRTGLVVHHSPRYRLDVEPGTVREQPYAPAETDTLRGAPTRAATRAAAPAAGARDDKGPQAARDLAAGYQRTGGSASRAGILPVTIPFPSFGPSRFLAAELTPEGRNIQVRFAVKRQGK